MLDRSRGVSIRLLLLVCFVLVASLAVLVVLGHRYHWLTVELEREENQENLRLARAVSLSVDRFMTARRHFISALASELSAKRLADTPRLNALLDVANGRERGFEVLGITNERGIVVGSSPAVDESGATAIGRSYAFRQWFIEVARGDGAQSFDVIVGRLERKSSVAVAAPIRDASGQFLGAVVGGVNLEDLRTSIRDIDPTHSERLVMTDARGRVIAHSSRAWEEEGRDLSGEAVFRAARQAREGTTQYDSEFTGTKRSAAYSRVPSTGWVVWASRGPETRASRVRSLVLSLVFSGLVSLLAAGVVSVGLSHALTRPLRGLGDFARRMAEGGVVRDQALPPQRTVVREFAELDASFRTMAQALQIQYDELEARVADRTRALEETTRGAEATSARLRAQDEIRRGYADLAALLNSLDRSYILNEGVRKIAASLRAPLAAVYLTDDAPSSLRLKTHWAVDTDALDSALLVAGGLPTRVAEACQPVVLVRPFGGEALRLSTGVGELEAAAVAGYPLQHQQRLMGVLVVALLAAPDEDTQSFLESAARQLSVALSNAALFEGTRYQSQRMEELNAALQRASQAKSQFLASMSHELRTPLNGIIGFTDVLLMGERDPLSPRQRTALEKVASSGRYLLGLINQVLDLSKIEAGRMEVHVGRVMLPALIAECVATVEPQAQAKRLELRAVGLDTAPQLFQDGDKVKQILLNLVSNAVKFTDAGRVEVRVLREGETLVRLMVADTGIGISPEHQGTIFEEFRQVDGAQRARGTGLGLAISRQLAELLGGTLTVESAPGQGSTFSLRLPVRYVPRADRLGMVPSVSAPGDLRVLVIEDDQNAVDIIREAVADRPITVAWASSATEGLERARSVRPDVIVLDVMLQDGGDGWQVLEQLKGDPVTRAIPVVIHSVIDNPERARSLGADDVLPKPASPGAILGLLGRFVAPASDVPSPRGT